MTDSGRLVCSPACASAVRLTEQTLAAIRDKTVTSARVTGYFSLALGIFIGAVASFPLSDGAWPVALLFSAVASVFVATGIAFLRIAKRKARSENED